MLHLFGFFKDPPPAHKFRKGDSVRVMKLDNIPGFTAVEMESLRSFIGKTGRVVQVFAEVVDVEFGRGRENTLRLRPDEIVLV